MSKVATIVKYKLLEQRNVIAEQPLRVLLWIPRLAFDVAAAVLSYHWLAPADQAWSALIFCAVPAFYFLISFIIVFQKLFSDRQTLLLLSTPFALHQLFTYKYLESSLFSLEIAIVMGLPLSFAIGRITSAATGVDVFFSLVLSLLIATSLAIVAVLLLARYVIGHRITVVAVTCLFIAALVGIIVWFVYYGINPLSGFLTSVESLWHYPGALIMLSSQVVVAALTTSVGLWLMTRSYHTCRSRLSQEQQSELKKRIGRSLVINLFAHSYSGSTAIFIKDIVMSLRYPMQLLRIALTLALIPAYLVIKPILSDASTELVIAANATFASGIIFILMGEATINTFAAEMNRVRLLIAAPIQPIRIVHAKFWANLLPMLIMCIIVALSIGLMSDIPTWAVILSIIATAATTTAFSAVLVGLGAFNSKPNTEAIGGMDQFMNEQVLINSPVSFPVFLASAVILAADVAIVFMPFILSKHNISTSTAITAGLTAGFLAINAIAIALSFKVGSSYLRRFPASRG